MKNSKSFGIRGTSQIAIFATFIFFATLISVPLANSAELSLTEKRYASAMVVQNVIQDLQAPQISNALKTLLLDRARPEDKAFVTSLVVQWKKNRIDKNIYAEFDQLVVRNSRGTEVLRMSEMNSRGSFVINGRPWTVPGKGSIEKSLRQHLVKPSAFNVAKPSSSFAAASLPTAAKIFAFVPRAEAARRKETKDVEPPFVNAAYLFVVQGIVKDSKPYVASATDTLALNQVQPYIFTGNPLIGFIKRFREEAFEVQCDGSTASGYAVIGETKVHFEVRADGRMVLTDQREGFKKIRATPKLTALPDKTMAVGTDMTYSACTRPDCTEIDPQTSRVTATSLLLSPSREAQKALAWRPSEGAQNRAKIIQDPSKKSDPFVLVDPGADLTVKALGVEDFQEAEKLRDEANAVENDRIRKMENSILSLRPLGTCCGDKTCRDNLASQKVILKPREGATSQ